MTHKPKHHNPDDFEFIEPPKVRLINPNTVTGLDTGSAFINGALVNFSGGGVRDAESGKPRFDLIRPKNVPYLDQMLTRFATHLGRGAEKYAARNWEQFSDESALERAKSSAARHFEQWFNGETDEDHAAAVWFNVMAAEYVKGVLAGEWEALSNDG